MSAFGFVHCLILALGSQLLLVKDNTLRSGVVLFFCYWAFYVHRNELLVQAGLQKQVVLVWSGCVLFAMLLAGALRSSRSPRGVGG